MLSSDGYPLSAEGLEYLRDSLISFARRINVKMSDAEFNEKVQSRDFDEAVNISVTFFRQYGFNVVNHLGKTEEELESSLLETLKSINDGTLFEELNKKMTYINGANARVEFVPSATDTFYPTTIQVSDKDNDRGLRVQGTYCDESPYSLPISENQKYRKKRKKLAWPRESS